LNKATISFEQRNKNVEGADEKIVLETKVKLPAYLCAYIGWEIVLLWSYKHMDLKLGF
jgi:hypothetical protein